MGSVLGLEEKPFKNREDIKAEIRRCSMFSSICMYASLIFVVLGIISDALNTTLGLASISWFLLAIIVSLTAIHPQMHVVLARHLLGAEAESK